MPANPATAKDFLFTTDYPIDKVVYLNQTTETVPSATFGNDSHTFTYPHGLGFAPLCIGAFSDDSFATSYDFGTAPYFFSVLFNQQQERIKAVVESDATNVYVRAINFDTTRALNFRIVGLAPSDLADGITPPPAHAGSNFFFNTDFNYMKIYMQGTATVAGSGEVSIPHDLGYAPTTMAFSNDGSRVRRVGAESALGSTGISTIVRQTATDIVLDVFDNAGSIPITFDYRIYLDE